MKSAFSKGEFFNAHIRDRYAFDRRTASAVAKLEIAWTGS
jgi:hypothetical protein